MNAISVLQEILNGFDFSGLRDILLRVIPALLCITLHELAHGFTAYALGDNTAKAAGRLTLNPIRHLDPMGLLMMVIFGFGYAKPVPVDMRHFKNPKQGMAITALAGPLCNVLISLVFYFLYGLLILPVVAGVAQVLQTKYNPQMKEQQNVQMNARALQSLTRDLFLKADVQDNRYLFY